MLIFMACTDTQITADGDEDGFGTLEQSYVVMLHSVGRT